MIAKQNAEAAVGQIYDQLKKSTKAQFIAASRAKSPIASTAQKSDGKIVSIDESHLELTWELAHKLDRSAFVKGYMDGEFPPVKLDNQSLEALNGGLWWFALGVVADVVGIAAAAYAISEWLHGPTGSVSTSYIIQYNGVTIYAGS